MFFWRASTSSRLWTSIFQKPTLLWNRLPESIGKSSYERKLRAILSTANISVELPHLGAGHSGPGLVLSLSFPAEVGWSASVLADRVRLFRNTPRTIFCLATATPWMPGKFFSVAVSKFIAASASQSLVVETPDAC